MTLTSLLFVFMALFHKNNCVFEKKLHDNTKIDQPLVPPYDWRIESFVSTVLIIFLFCHNEKNSDLLSSFLLSDHTSDLLISENIDLHEN